MNYTFFGTDQSYCLGDTANERNLGTWSDGQPVIPVHVSDAAYWGP